MTPLIMDVIGWIGAVAVLVAYWLVSSHRLSAASVRYQWLNIVGAIGLMINAVYHEAYPSTGVNVIWLGIAVCGLIGIGRERIKKT